MEKNETMSREAAIAEIKGWARALGEVYNDDEIETSKVLAALINGRVTFDEESESFVYMLLKPVVLQNGKTLDSITIEEPTSEYMLRRSTMKYKDGTGEVEIDLDSRFLSAATNQSVGVLQRIKTRDMMVIKELAHFFG